jgi:periplasmic protein TonB
MFDDFQPSSSNKAARKRMGGSAVAAAVLYGVGGVLLLGGTTAATKNVVETLTQVEFAPPPPPPPPPPVIEATAQPVVNARPKVKRRELKPPDSVPTEKPKESNADLSAAEPSGPVDGFLNGVEGGTGTAAAPPRAVLAPPPAPAKPEPLIAAVASKSNASPPYSASAKRKEIEGVVVVSFDILENGTTANARIMSGPEEFRENVLKTVATWRFTPAQRGGKPIRSHQSKAIRFQLSDA